MVRLITSLILIGLISSCSAEWHLKKALKKDPAIIETKVINIYDTLWTNSIKFKDSINIDFKDSIVITNDTVQVKLYKNGRKQLIVKTVVKPYPIYKKVRIIQTKYRNSYKSLWWQVLVVLVSVVGVSKVIDKALSNGKN
jgi:hypothetical protein